MFGCLFFLKVTSVFLYVALLIAAVPYCRLHFSWALGDIYVLWGAWGNISFQTSEKQTLQLWLASMSYFRFLIWRSFFLCPPFYFGEETQRQLEKEDKVISMQCSNFYLYIYCVCFPSQRPQSNSFSKCLVINWTKESLSLNIGMQFICYIWSHFMESLGIK